MMFLKAAVGRNFSGFPIRSGMTITQHRSVIPAQAGIQSKF